MLKLKVAKWGAVAGLCGTMFHYSSHGYVQAERAVLERFSATQRALVEDVAHQLGFERPVPPMTELDALEIAEREALRHRINPSLVRAVLQHESRQEQFAESPAGAIGYMQVMPEHVKFCGLKHWSQLYDDEINIKCGVKILAHELEATRGDVTRALKRYNGGPKCDPGPCKESERYVPAVLRLMASDIR